jgi:hypothetical protein
MMKIYRRKLSAAFIFAVATVLIVSLAHGQDDDTTRNVLKQGLLGAGTGAIAAGASGGDAGKGALIGAGTGVIGGALLDSITQPSQQPRRVYRRAPRQRVQTQTRQVQQVQPQQQVQEETAADGSRKKVIKKYDDTGKLVSEEEIYY